MSKWQPIETVPPPGDKGGARVLIYDPTFDLVMEARAYSDGRFFDPVYWEWDGTGATHWMPLPDPPCAVAQRDEEIS